VSEGKGVRGKGCQRERVSRERVSGTLFPLEGGGTIWSGKHHPQPLASRKGYLTPFPSSDTLSVLIARARAQTARKTPSVAARACWVWNLLLTLY